MKCYLLLRENVENGPYTLDELKALNLLPTDLIWVEGSSQCWRFPYEINGLASFVQPAQQKEKQTFEPDAASPTSRVFVAFPPQLQNLITPAQLAKYTTDAPEASSEPQTPLPNLETQLEEHHRAKAFRFRASRQTSPAMGWIAAVCTGVLISAVLIKKMVDAVEVQQLPVKAAAALPDSNPQAGGAEDKTYRNALATELVPVDTAVALEKPVKKAKKVSIKKQVRVRASAYRKGVFGGIQGLTLLVDNASDHVLDKVTIEVAYLKPNGDVIEKENHHLRAVAPKSSKTLVVPPSKRGVKVEYKITKIQSHEARLPMRDA